MCDALMYFNYELLLHPPHQMVAESACTQSQLMHLELRLSLHAYGISISILTNEQITISI